MEKLEREGVITRHNAAGERALFDLEEVAPLIVEWLMGVSRRKYEQAKIAEVRERIKKNEAGDRDSRGALGR